MKRLSFTIVAASIGPLVMLSAFAQPPNCTYCKCDDVTGTIVANKVGKDIVFNSGRWYYIRNKDGSSGGPINNAAVRLHYTGTVTCVENEQSQKTGTTINRYIVTVPNPLPCTAANPKVGHNMLYAAKQTPPTDGDDDYLEGPDTWSQAECIPPGGE